MFVGHLAVAFAAKRLQPKVALPWFVAGTLLVDLIWPLLLLAGVESVRIAPGAMPFTPLVFESYPWTHSLAMGIVWGLLFAGIAHLAGVAREALPLLALIVPSHWLLDLTTHAPDLPLWPGRDGGLGLGLWNSVAGTFAVEGALWIGAIALFLGVRKPRGATGQVALWGFVALATMFWASGPFSPPPADARSLAFAALGLWLFVPWAWWIERSSSGRGPLGGAVGNG
jgi:hypothetical protein